MTQSNIATDTEGYLIHLNDWTPELALQFATDENLELTPLHWEIIRFIRVYFLEHNDMPKMRTLITYLRSEAPYKEVSSATIHRLFPLSPALQIAKIAGLPKPIRCL